VIIEKAIVEDVGWRYGFYFLLQPLDGFAGFTGPQANEQVAAPLRSVFQYKGCDGGMEGMEIKIFRHSYNFTLQVFRIIHEAGVHGLL